MAQKTTERPATTTPAVTDIVAIVTDPGGSPVSSKVTVADLLQTAGAALPGTVAFSATARLLGRKTAGAGAGEELTIPEALGLAAGQYPFPATQNPSADANTLDDYEEGTWVPTVGASAGTLTSVSANGWYTKIGNLVMCHLIITIATNGTGSGHLFSSIPFAPGGSGQVMGVGREGGVSGKSLNLDYSPTTIQIFNYDNSYPGASGAVLTIGFWFTV